MDVHVEIYIRTQDILAEISGIIGLSQRTIENLGTKDKLASNIDVARSCANGRNTRE